jgi:hypothetical protein
VKWDQSGGVWEDFRDFRDFGDFGGFWEVGAAMGVGSLFVDMKLSYVKQQFRAHGLRSETVRVDDGATVIRCWVPWQQPERGVWSAGESDKPVVLFLHDFVADGTLNWENQIGTFTKDFNVYVPDLVFFGGSSSSSQNEKTEAFQAECMVKMLHALGVYNEVRNLVRNSRIW